MKYYNLVKWETPLDILCFLLRRFLTAENAMFLLRLVNFKASQACFKVCYRFFQCFFNIHIHV